MGQCCASHPGDQNELNDIKKPTTATGTDDAAQIKVETESAVKIQAYYRGVMTRKLIKEQYGFESKTKNDLSKSSRNGQDDQNVQEARRLVLQI